MRISKESKPPARAKPGRRPDSDYNQWDLALDLIEPSATRRRTRVLAALEHRDATLGGPLAEFKELAQKAGLHHRKVWTFVIADPKRPGALTIDDRRKIAHCLIGITEAEPWMSSGQWRSPDDEVIAPGWLLAMRYEQTLERLAYWMAMAHLRAGQRHEFFDHRVQAVLTDDQRVVISLRGDPKRMLSAKAGRQPMLSLSDLQRLAPGMTDDQRMIDAATPLMDAMKRAKLDAGSLWTRFPRAVLKAAKDVIAGA
jgi:hypothetical protein